MRRTEPAAPGPSGSGGRGCRCSASRRRRFRRRPPQTGRCTGDLGGRSARRPQPDGGGRRRLAPAPGPGAGVRPPPGPGRQTYRPAQNPPQQAAFGGAGQDGGCHSGRRGQGWPLRHPGEWPGFPSRRQPHPRYKSTESVLSFGRPESAGRFAGAGSPGAADGGSWLRRPGGPGGCGLGGVGCPEYESWLPLSGGGPGGVTGTPGPLEIVAAAVAVYVQKLAAGV